MSVVSKGPSARDAHERLTAIRDGDLDAFLDAVEPWLDSVYEVVITILGSPNAALDATRETFESLWYRHAQLTADELTRDSLLLAAQATALARLDRVGRPELSTDDKHAVLARAASVVLGADEISYLDLYLRHGVGVDALGEALGISGREVPHRFERTRVDRDEVRAAFALWNGGQPTCSDLFLALDGATEFDATVVGIIGAHRGDCIDCARVHGSVLHPARQLLAAPAAALTPAATSDSDAEPLGQQNAEKDIEQDIEELWASTEADRRARVTVPAAPYVPVRRSRWRPDTTVIAIGVAVLVVAIAGGVALALLGSGNDEPDTIQSEPATEQAPSTDPEEVPPPTDPTTESSTEPTSESESESEPEPESEPEADSTSESTTASDSTADSGTESTTDSEPEPVVAGESGEIEPLPSLDVQLDSCVALGEFGAFVGSPEWVDVWSEVGESEDGLRSWCEETPDPLQRLEFYDEWLALQESLTDADAAATTASPS